ncbi:MAG: HAMP domain-containing protein [Acidobacteria bacterium]|nr:HAMP domain-containing protein [Acidobacteriota bacterium]
MALTVKEASARQQPVAPPSRRRSAPQRRRPFRDNTKLILAGIGVLIVGLASLLALASRSASLEPDFLTEVVLYALSATNLTILVALVFVLARNIVKLLVEKRRGLPFAHFRAKLVAVLLGMTLIPAVLVLLVGSGLIRNSVDRWFNAPMEDVLSSANAIAGDYYQERQRLVSAQAQRLARALGAIDLSSAPAATVREMMKPDGLQERVGLVEVYRVEPTDASEASLLIPVVDVGAATLPRTVARPLGDRLAARAAAGEALAPVVERLPNGGDLIRSAVPIRSSRGERPQGVVVASEYVTGQFAARARRMTQAYEDYQQLRVLKQPLAGVYLSFFLTLTLMILVGSTWMGLYLAKRITRPVQMLATAANEIGAGHFDHRVEPETRDEFGSLVEAFNRMASDLSTSRRRLERSAIDLERKHQDVEGRRRYVETILERIAAGVVSVDAAGRIRTMNSAASRLLGLDERAVGVAAATVFGSTELKPLAALIDEPSRSREDAPPQEVSIARGGRERHLSVMTTPLRREDGVSDGVVLVFDDVTALIRAEKVAAWREVARRLAHEIKNPLTPIQLCAERMRRHFAGASTQTRELVEECTSTIVGEVESLKGLVDEFSQFARMPAPRAVPTDLHLLLTEVLALYRGIFTNIELRPRFATDLPKVSVDPEQIRRVLTNVIDNAVEAMQQRGTIEIETRHARPENLVRIVVADDGPGIPPAERDKLFLPHYSTKQRGSGVGLAIVRRIVAEHGGSIDVTDNVPRGTRFAIALPC